MEVKWEGVRRCLAFLDRAGHEIGSNDFHNFLF